MIYFAGWWFGTWILFSIIYSIIIATNFHIFQRGWNHQPVCMMRELNIWPRRHLCDTCQSAKACEASRRKLLDLTHAKASSPQRSWNVLPDACLSRIPGPVCEARRSPCEAYAKPSWTNFLLSPSRLRIWGSNLTFLSPSCWDMVSCSG